MEKIIKRIMLGDLDKLAAVFTDDETRKLKLNEKNKVFIFMKRKK